MQMKATSQKTPLFLDGIILRQWGFLLTLIKGVKMFKVRIVALVVVSLFLLANNGCPLSPAPVSKTGQTSCFDEDGIKMDCTGTGQDGEFQRGVKWPNPRFTDNSDGTITDNLAGLIWLKDANCFEMGTWADALSNCNGLADGSCGLTDGSRVGDWRLPNVKELQSLINFEYTLPAFPNTAGTGQWSEDDPFYDVQSIFYWSSTACTFSTDSAWIVDMGFGSTNYSGKLFYYWVWPVRGGQ